MTITELQAEEERIRIRYELFRKASRVKEAVISFTAAEDLKRLSVAMMLGYPPLSSDWLISLWEIYPYEGA